MDSSPTFSDVPEEIVEKLKVLEGAIETHYTESANAERIKALVRELALEVKKEQIVSPLTKKMSFGALKPTLTPRKPSTGALQANDNATIRQCIAAAIYFLLESALIRCDAERLTLYVKPANNVDPDHFDLKQLVNVGAGMPTVRREVLANSTGIANAVCASGIAVNLPSVNLEDVADCPGPTKAKNALVFPVRSLKSWKNVLGVMFLVNKSKGAAAFTSDDELTLFGLAPSVSYLVESYPIDYVTAAFDPTSIHRLVPLRPSAPISLLPPEFAAPSTQLVYHRNGREKFIRRQVLEEAGTSLRDEVVAENLRSVESYIKMIEESWKMSVIEAMEIEKQLRQKQGHIADAREILQRKQRKLDLLKDALCEQLQKASEGPSLREKKKSTVSLADSRRRH